jgi:hypothetical protein
MQAENGSDDLEARHAGASGRAEHLGSYGGHCRVAGAHQPCPAGGRASASSLHSVAGHYRRSACRARRFLLYTPLTDAFHDIAQPIVEFPFNATAFLVTFLPLILFHAALTIDVRELVEDAAPILTLAIVAVFVRSWLVLCSSPLHRNPRSREITS